MTNYKQLRIPGIQAGGYTDSKLKSGITIFTINRPNVAGIYQSGGSPASRETDILRSIHRPDYSIDALIFTGRSVYGFEAATIVMKKLSEKGIGVKLGNSFVPLIPSLAIFDFYKNFLLPDFQIWVKKSFENLGTVIPIGKFWAGTGATVGKIKGIDYGKDSGQGYYVIEDENLYVGVYVIVNSLGNVYNLDGKNIFDKNENLKQLFTDNKNILEDSSNVSLENTTIGAVFTNAKLDNREANYLAQIANFGFASRIFPYSLGYDGDTVICVSTGNIKVPIDKLSYLTRIASEMAILSIFEEK